MRVVQIPGGTAALREPHEIRVRHKRMVEVAGIAAAPVLEKLREFNMSREELERIEISKLGLTRAEAESFYELRDAIIIAELVSWDLPAALPTLNTVGDLEPNVFEALATATQKDIGAVLTGVDFSPPNPRSPEFADSPTVPSDDSESVLRADQQSTSIETRSSYGPSIPTDASFPD